MQLSSFIQVKTIETITIVEFPLLSGCVCVCFLSIVWSKVSSLYSIESLVPISRAAVWLTNKILILFAFLLFNSTRLNFHYKFKSDKMESFAFPFDENGSPFFFFLSLSLFTLLFALFWFYFSHTKTFQTIKMN